MTQPINISRHKGMTLLEVTASLAIGAIIIMGALSLYSNANSSTDSALLVREMSSMRTAVKSLFVGQVGFGTASLNNSLIVGGKLPSSWTSAGTTITNEYGGDVVVTGNTTTFNITSGSIPKDVCVNGLPAASQGWSSAGVGATAAAAITAAAVAPITPASAASACTATTQFIAFIGS